MFNIKKTATTLFFCAILIAPSVVAFFHLFEHHHHVAHCNETATKHIHENESKSCFVCKFNFSNAETITSATETIIIFSEAPFYFSYKQQHYLSSNKGCSLTRGPPVYFS